MTRQIDDVLVDQLYRRAKADRWQVPVEHFARALEASAAKAFAGGARPARDEERYLGSLRLEELALACACAAGNAVAWDHFVLEYRPVLYRAADAMDPGGGARELADSLYADLFGLDVGPSTTDKTSTYVVSGFSRTGGASGPGRTAEERKSLFRYFHGRSSLATWLRAVLAQRQVDRARAGARTAPLPDEEPAAPGQHEPDPDRRRYLALIHAAFRDAVAGLDPRDRLRLRYYYAQKLTMAETGRLLREHEASVSRHLSAARKAIRRDVERRLAEARLDPDEIAQCFAYVTEDAGPLDLDRLLEEAPDARNPEPNVQSEETSARAGKAMLDSHHEQPAPLEGSVLRGRVKR